MKKLVYLLFFTLLMGNVVNAQTATFTTYSGNSDTAKASLIGTGSDLTVDNPIKAISDSVYIKTTVLSVNVPSGVTPQFCDNTLCRNTAPFDVYHSFPYHATFGPNSAYHAVFQNMSLAPSPSVAVITVKAQDSAGGYSRTLTFIGYKSALGVTSTQVQENDDVVIYPNPAGDVVNVVYNKNAGIKKISIYNLIGKMMQAYIPMDNRSAKLDIDNIPTGVYFIRLMDGQGHVVATRRFTRQ